MSIEQIGFVAAIMSFEATLLWQLFKMKKGFDLMMSFSGYGESPNWIRNLEIKVDKLLDIAERLELQ